MKNLLLIIAILVSCNLFAQDTLTHQYWTAGTAYTLPAHQTEIGLLTSSRYGLTNHLELSAHPLLFFILPHLSLKANWGDFGGFEVATEHGLVYPTQFFELVAAKGTGGLISPEFRFPQMFSFRNALLVSYRPFRNALLNGHAGFTFSTKFGSLDPNSTIDLPIFYPRLAVFYHQPEVDMGIDLRGKFIPRLGWYLGVDNYLFGGTIQNYFMENKGALVYTSSREKLRIELGYKLCYGKYPAGPQWHLLPAFDMIFGFR